MKTLKLLIDLAREKAHGNEAELARSVGVPAHHPHEWRTGKRAMSAESVVAVCDYLGLTGDETREWVAVALIENPKNASRADMLKRALFACWVGGVGALFTLPTTDAKAIGTALNAEPQAGLARGVVTAVDSLNMHWRASLLLVLRVLMNRPYSYLTSATARAATTIARMVTVTQNRLNGVSPCF